MQKLTKWTLQPVRDLLMDPGTSFSSLKDLPCQCSLTYDEFFAVQCLANNHVCSTPPAYPFTLGRLTNNAALILPPEADQRQSEIPPPLKLEHRGGCRELVQDPCMQTAVWMGLVVSLSETEVSACIFGYSLFSWQGVQSYQINPQTPPKFLSKDGLG